MLAAEVWHWWIGVVLALAGIFMSVFLVMGYLRKVVAPQYPKRRQRP